MKALLVAGLFTLCALLGATPSQACSLAAPVPTDLEKIYSASTLALGAVTDVDASDGAFGAPVTFTLRVDQLYRGAVPASVRLKTSSSSMCGFSEGLSVGQELGIATSQTLVDGTRLAFTDLVPVDKLRQYGPGEGTPKIEPTDWRRTEVTHVSSTKRSRVVYISVVTGACETVRLVKLRQGPTKIAIRAEVGTNVPAGTACPALAQLGCYRVTLAKPRGARTISDFATGKRLRAAPLQVRAGKQCAPLSVKA